ncbi:MAG: hypothetical protein V3S88_06285, partial [Alphaproteobacteria bacterium]
AVSVVTGTEDASPVAPAIPAGKVPVAQVALVVSQTTILNSDITDERALKHLGATPGFSAHRNSVGQSIAASTWTKLKLTTEDFDTDGDFLHDADDSGGATESRFTPSVPGKYLIVGAAVLAGLADGKAANCSIHKNGAFHRLGTRVSQGAAGNQHVGVGVIVEANGTTDYFEFFVWHDDTVSRTAGGVATDTYFQGHYLGA